MMSSDAFIAPDVHQALQHAIGEANSAFDSSSSFQPVKKKKRKRSRDDDHVPIPQGVSASAPTAGRKRKRAAKKPQSQPADSSLANGKEYYAHSNAPPHEQNSIPIDPQLSLHAAPQSDPNSVLSAFLGTGPMMHDVQHMPIPNFMGGYDPGFPPPHANQQPSFNPQAMFLNSSGQPLPPLGDPQITNGISNEEIIRFLQELDLTKIASYNFMKNMGEASTVNNVNMAPTGMPEETNMIPPVVPTFSAGQVPVASYDILGQTPKNIPKISPVVAKNTTAVSMPAVGPEQNPDHAHLLATKWMNATKLALMVQQTGLVYKKGKFSTIEEDLVKTAVENYRVQKDLTHEQLREIIFAKKEKQKDNSFWSEITSQVPQRPIIAVYHHVRRMYHPFKQQGRWMPAEDDILRQAVVELGQSWEKVSLRVGRMAADCRDRWRNHINHREDRISGPWSKEEEEKLIQIVTEMTIAQGKDQDNDVFWGQVAERMGNKRGRQQCRIKWTDSLSRTVKNNGRTPRWSQQDAYILVHKIASLNVRDDSEIDWKLLPDSDWNLWSAHTLQRRWLTLKKSVKGYEEMSHQEIMDILRVKKAQIPPATIPRKSRVTSAPNVPADAEQSHADTDAASDTVTGVSELGMAETRVPNGQLEDQEEENSNEELPEDAGSSDSDSSTSSEDSNSSDDSE